MPKDSISFWPAMILSLLSGKKTEMRRALKCLTLEEARADPYFEQFEPRKLLWVRESIEQSTTSKHVVYSADRTKTDFEYPHHWKGLMQPAMYMPREFSRLTIEVLDRGLERLQDITADGAIAEGLTQICKDKSSANYRWGIPDRDGFPGTDNFGWPWIDWNADPRMAYAKLWTTLNGTGSWDKNPLVVVVKFKLHRINIDKLLGSATHAL